MLNNGFLSAGRNQVDKILATGSNSNGRTGLNTIVGNTGGFLTRAGNLGNWDYLSCGFSHSMGIRDGKLYAWGNNANGRTGFNTTVGNTLVPTLITSPLFSDWTKVQCTQTGTIALRAGRIYSCGSNALAATGQNTTVGDTLVLTEITSPSHTDWFDIAMTNLHGHALRSTGLLYSWGDNTNYGTGLGTNVGTTNVPTQVGAFTNWTDIGAGGSCGWAIRAGTLYGWGDGANYRAGLGVLTATTAPTLITSPSHSDWTSIANGLTSGAALRSTGLLYTWGDNTNARTAQGVDTGDTINPTQVGVATNWSFLNMGLGHGVGLRGNDLYVWGNNTSGEGGQGTTGGNILSPTQIGASGRFRFAAAGLSYTLTIPKN